MANAKIICYCGHDCARCITYRAAIENNDDLRRKSQKFYRDVFKKIYRLGKSGVPAAEPTGFSIFAKSVRGWSAAGAQN